MCPRAVQRFFLAQLPETDTRVRHTRMRASRMVKSRMETPPVVIFPATSRKTLSGKIRPRYPAPIVTD